MILIEGVLSTRKQNQRNTLGKRDDDCINLLYNHHLHHLQNDTIAKNEKKQDEDKGQ